MPIDKSFNQNIQLFNKTNSLSQLNGSIKYLNNFHTNIPARIPYDRSSTGRKQSENPKSKYNSQFNNQLLNYSNVHAQFINKKFQSKDVDQLLSNNISNILEKLLIDYDKNERPNLQGKLNYFCF